MRNRMLFLLAVLGILLGFASAWFFGIEKKPLAPVFDPAPNPYARGIYANGIIESYQSNGENINIFPEVSGTVAKILVDEGAAVKGGDTLLILDHSIQKAVVEQQKAQVDAAQAVIEQLKAQPRKENLEVAKAQVESAAAAYKTSLDQLEKRKKANELNRRLISQDELDNVQNAVKLAEANLAVAQKQYELTRAGAWIYDIRYQEHQREVLLRAYESAKALLDKYTIRAPVDGVILSVNTAVGSLISPQGTYGTYTQGSHPVLVMASSGPYYGVRCYIDEILISRLPPPPDMKARMFFRGTKISVPLEYVRIKPYVTPKVELSNQRTERVDVRVLPVLFRFEPPRDVSVYPGQLVDVYLQSK